MSCANRKNYNQDNSYTKLIWTDNLVLSYNGNNYKVKAETTKDIGSFIGKIAFHGNVAVFNLYSIKNVKEDEQIAVDIKERHITTILQK